MTSTETQPRPSTHTSTHAWLAAYRHVAGFDIAAHVARRHAARAAAREHQMRVVLTDAVAEFERLRRRARTSVVPGGYFDALADAFRQRIRFAAR